MTTSHRRRRAVALAAIGTLVVGAAGCGDDDEDADLSAYCDAEVQIEQAFAEVDFEDPAAVQPPSDDARPLIDRIVELSPGPVRDANQVFADVIAEVGETGDPSAMEGEAVAEATEAVHAYDIEHCDWDVVDVAASDFAFDADFPTAAGPTSFELTNTGEEPHALVVARKLDAVDGSALDAFAALEGEEDFAEAFEEVVGAFADPGGTGHGIVDLPAGEYVVFCPIPTGTSGEAPGDGPPHFTQGMVGAFEVG